MKHAALLELRLRHLFYTDSRCPDLAIDPSQGTARLLEKHRCLLRGGPGLARVVTPLDDAGRPFLPLPAGASLLFELRSTNGDLALFTDLSALLATPSPLFTNAGLAAGATGELELTSRTAADPETGEQVPVRQAPGALAEVEIVLHPGSSHGRALPAAAFQITLQPRRWHWAYYCLTDLAAGGGALTIADTSPPGTAGAPSFGDASWTDHEAPDLSDPIALQLAARNTGMRCVRFVSEQAITCREEPRTHLALQLDSDRVSSPLPNPSLRSFTRRELPAPAPGPQDMLFQIIEYRAQPFPNP